MDIPVIDTHCHLDFPDYDADRDQVIRRSLEHGLAAMVNVGSTLETSRRAAAVAAESAPVYACVGCHPHDADSFRQEHLVELAKLCRGPKVVGIGETGLDYYRNLSSPEDQKKVFLALAALAADTGLALVVHTRQAEDDTLAVLREAGARRVIIHCFSGDAGFLAACMDRGYYISFACNITYKKSQPLRDVARLAPLERICVETDAPYLSPEGSRGKRNEPWMCRMAADEIARAKGIAAEEVYRATTENAKKFFGIG